MQWAQRHSRTLTGEQIQLPDKRRIDGRLVTGSLLFGAGWGIAGFCPGPAVVAVGAGVPLAMLFMVAMLAGMGLFTLSDRLVRA